MVLPTILADGTAAGTYMLADIALGTASSSSAAGRLGPVSSWAVTNPGAANETIYFEATTSTYGLELYKYIPGNNPPSTASIGLVKDILPGSNSGADVAPLTAIGDKVYYGCYNSSLIKGICISDGTSVGTYRIDVSPQTGFSPQQVLAFPDGYVYFSTGSDVWRTDGTLIGSSKIKSFSAVVDMYPEVYYSPNLSGPQMVFVVSSGLNGQQLFFSNGSTFSAPIFLSNTATTSHLTPTMYSGVYLYK